MEPFFKAVKTNNIPLLQQIRNEKHIDINRPDKDGKTAFLIAAEDADCTILQWLVQQSADIKAEYETRTALYYVVLTYSGSPKVKAEKLAYLTTLGFTFNHLSFALVCSNHWQDLKIALTQDSNFLNHQDHWGNNILHYAAAWGNLAALKWIAEHMVVHSIDSKETLLGMTPLHRACSNGHYLVVNQRLVEIELNNVTYSSDLSDHLQAYLEGNEKRNRVSSMAAWTNVLRNVKEDDQTLDPNLPRARTNIASLQGYCTFFVRKLGITTKFNQQQGWEAYYKSQRLLLSPLIIEAISTGVHEYIEGITLIKS